MSAVFSISKRNKPVELIPFQTGILFILFVINRRRNLVMKSMQVMHPPPGLAGCVKTRFENAKYMTKKQIIEKLIHIE
jgi:hypothetical protein